MFTKEVIGKMKKGSYLVNNARGGIVDREAVLEACKSGHLAGAAISLLHISKTLHVLFHVQILCASLFVELCVMSASIDFQSRSSHQLHVDAAGFSVY